ncbi:hypothetical protein V6K52_01070 [Knoellia sp. S7-12]
MTTAMVATDPSRQRDPELLGGTTQTGVEARDGSAHLLRRVKDCAVGHRKARRRSQPGKANGRVIVQGNLPDCEPVEPSQGVVGEPLATPRRTRQELGQREWAGTERLVPVTANQIYCGVVAFI